MTEIIILMANEVGSNEISVYTIDAFKRKYFRSTISIDTDDGWSGANLLYNTDKYTTTHDGYINISCAELMDLLMTNDQFMIRINEGADRDYIITRDKLID